jgi:hypothetical protein
LNRATLAYVSTAEGRVVLPRALLREYTVEVVALATSPGHSYWFHSRDPSAGVGPHPTIRPQAVDVVAGQGIVGDRFFGKVEPLSSAVSFVAAEAAEEVARELGLAPDALDPVRMRRNVVLRGVDLNALRRGSFALKQGDAPPLWFEAGGETSPCAWMDAVLAPGARDLLRGRGGLRAGPVTSGRLAVGPATLLTEEAFDPARAGERVRRGRLP